MTKKFLALTLALILVAGFSSAADEERVLTGEWENELTLISEEEVFSDYDSDLEIT